MQTFTQFTIQTSLLVSAATCSRQDFLLKPQQLCQSETVEKENEQISAVVLLDQYIYMYVVSSTFQTQ